MSRVWGIEFGQGMGCELRHLPRKVKPTCAGPPPFRSFGLGRGRCTGTDNSNPH